MRAHVENTASRIILAVTAAVSILIIGYECPAQDVTVGNQLWVTIENHTGDQIATGDLELLSIRNGGEELVSTISMRQIPVTEGTTVVFPDPLQGGRRYRVIFRADWAADRSKVVYFKSKGFVFPRVPTYSIQLDIEPAHVVHRLTGRLIRFELNDNANLPKDIFVKPRDLIELDYTSLNVGQLRIAARGGARPNVVDVSPIGPRHILVNGATVSVASFFEAKSPGDDWVSIDIDGVTRTFHIWVR
jgi:hypothetical protein